MGCETANHAARGHPGIALAARQGLGLEARILRDRDPSCRWTHLGLAFKRPRSRSWTVVHADPGSGRNGRVREEPFAEFAALACCARLIPWPTLDAESARQLRHEAEQHLGWPFDGRYDWTRTDAVYCTSFLWRIFNDAGIAAPQPPFPLFVLPMLGARELILPSLFIRLTGDPWH